MVKVNAANDLALLESGRAICPAARRGQLDCETGRHAGRGEVGEDAAVLVLVY